MVLQFVYYHIFTLLSVHNKILVTQTLIYIYYLKTQGMTRFVHFLSLMSVLLASVHACHYACSTCTEVNSYQNCTACQLGTFQKTYDLDAANSSVLVHRNIGVCSIVEPRLNILGIVMLVFACGYYVFSLRRNALLIINSLQNLAILSLSSVFFISPVSYIMSSLQYFLLFLKTATPGYDRPTDSYLLFSGKSSLQNLLGTTDLIENIKVVDIIITFLIFSAFLVPIYWAIQDHVKGDDAPAALNEQSHNNNKQQTGQPSPSPTPRKAAVKQNPRNTYFRYFKALVGLAFFFTLCENFIAIAVQLKYGQQYAASNLVIAFYFFLCVYFFVYTYYRPLPLFRLRFLDFLNYAKKPIVCILSVCLDSSLAVPVILLISVLVESAYEYKFKGFSHNKLLMFSRCLEGMVCTQFIAYCVLDSQGTNLQGSTALAFLMTIQVGLLYSLLLVDAGIYIKQTYFTSRVQAVNNTMTTQHDNFVRGNNQPSVLFSQSHFEQNSELPIANNVKARHIQPALTIELEDDVAGGAPEHPRNQDEDQQLEQDIQDVPADSKSAHAGELKEGQEKDENQNEFEQADKDYTVNKSRQPSRDKAAITTVMDVITPKRRRIRDRTKDNQIKQVYGFKK